MTAIDPASLLTGFLLGCVICRCVFLYWKEKVEKVEKAESIVHVDSAGDECE